MVFAIDPNEPVLFNIDEVHEPDLDAETGERGGPLKLEGVTIPFDILEFGNGQLPDSMLQRVGVGGHRLHRTAADAFTRWRALAAPAGIDLTCTDSYRTLDQQIELKQRKPEWSATPGRSVHGWGFAVDVSVGMPPKSFGMSVLKWLQDNGPPNGWFLGRPKDEPWHWVYRGAGSAAGGSTPTGAAPMGDADPGANTEVRLGSSGLSVQIVRDLLNLPVGDSFDDDTDAAVRAFQQSNGLTVDGRVGPRTWSALRSTTAPADRPEVALESTGDAVRWVQRRLGVSIDGQFGPLTEAAVVNFQRTAGLAPDGRVGPITWAALIA